jgi:hypothetical protein
MKKMFTNRNHDEMDPRLEAMLDQLRSTPERDRQRAEQGKAQFLKDADLIFTNAPAVGHKSFWFLLREKLAFTRVKMSQRTVLASFLAVFALVVLLSGSAGMTVYAAQSALPGDALYGVKTTLEDTRSNLTSSAARQVTLQLQYAQRRLDEIEKLIAEGRYADIQVATQDFQSHIQNTLAAMKDVTAGDPIKAAELAGQISTQLTRYSQALNSMADQTPGPVRSELEKALQASQSGELMEIKPDGEVEITGLIEAIGADTLVVGGQTVQITAETAIKLKLTVGLLVNVHAYLDLTGNVIAREIDGALPVQDDNRVNANSNTNQRIDANENDREGNTNANETGAGKGDNGNANVGSNDNEDNRQSNSNINEGSPGDQGGNTNEGGSNGNTNDHDGNDNEGKQENNENNNDNGGHGG